MKLIGSSGSRDNNPNAAHDFVSNRPASPRAPQTHAERTAVRQYRSDQPETPLTPEQHVALQKVLHEKAKEKTQSEHTQSIPIQRAAQSAQMQQRNMQQRPMQQRPVQRRPVKQLPIQQRPGDRRRQVNNRRIKKRSVSNVIITILLIIIFSGAGFFGWYYWWTEHATFDYQLQAIVALDGQRIQPDVFIFPSEDMERVTAAFTNPSFRPVEGRQNVQLTLTRGWRSVNAVAPLYVMTTMESFEHEFREVAEEMRAIDFVTNLEEVGNVLFDVRFTEEPMLLEEYSVGSHALQLSLNNAPFEVLLIVVDTIAPTAIGVNKTIWVGETVLPEDFLGEIFDESEILSMEFIYEPDVLAHRDQIVEVEITDIHGNSAVFSGALTILLNSEPPVIEGTDAIVSVIGDPILYLQGITAFDDFDRDITDRIKVDSSAVDQFKVGQYDVIYTVEDFTGQLTEITEKVHIVDIDIDFVHEKVDDALVGIINDDMTQLEKVRAIHTWVRSNINYAVTRGGPESSYEGAYIALSQRRGNCFIFYSISEVMLTRAGIPNMRIERIPGTPTAHRWNLVNPDNLGWHHFDSYPTRLGLGPQMAFFTSTQAGEFTRRIANLEERPMLNYYTYNPELYPEIAR